MGSNVSITELKAGSPNKVAEALQRKGYDITADTIRLWCKQDKIPFTMRNANFIVHVDRIIEFIDYGENDCAS